MDFWRRSSTAEKTAISVVAVALLCALVALGVFLTNQLRSTETEVAEGDDAFVTPTAASVEGSPTAPAPDAGGVVIIGAERTTNVIIGVVPTAVPGAPTITANANVNVHSGPGTQYPITGVLGQGQTAKVVGVSADGAWWAIDFPTSPSGQGWVAGEFVTAQNAETVPVLEAPPVPAPTPTPGIVITDWRGEYFANRDLQGAPTVTRNDGAIDFDWGTSPPADGMPSENWSARWTISRNVPAGTYRFTAHVDDGMRLYVDDVLIIDSWQEGAARTLVADVNVAEGAHAVRVEYFQAGGAALMRLQIDIITGYPNWKAEYFDNPNVDGNPKVVRNDLDINFNWGTNSPVPGVVPNDNYSIRWSRRSDFDQGVYTFIVDVEGGARLWLDGVLLIDSWTSSGARQLVADSQSLGKGGHDLRVDYFKATGNGSIRVRWQKKYVSGPPKAVINGNTRVQAGQTASFNARNSRAVEGSHLVTFDWDFGDGTTASGVDVSHVYNTANNYQVRLTVTDDKGQSDTTTQQIEVTQAPVTPEPPQAVIESPDNGQVGQPVTFNGGRSSGTHPLVGYQWDFGDSTTANAVSINKTYNAAGLYTVRLTVTDDQGLQGQTTKQVNISEQAATATPPPAATATPTQQPQAPVITSFTATPNQINLGQSVQLAWEFSGIDLASARILRGGQEIAFDIPNTGSMQDSPPNAGQVVYELVVDAEFGGSARQSAQVNVIGPEPTQPPQNTPTPVPATPTTPPQDTATPPPQDTPTPVPATPTTPPQDTPTPSEAAPVIDSFSASSTQVDPANSECSTISWSFTGGTAAATLSQNGQPVQFDLPQTGSYEFCPTINDGGENIFQLKIDNEFSGSAEQELTISVVAG